MKVTSIVGARPQFVKASVVSRELRLNHHEVLVHTGQHYDSNLSDLFFEELDIPRPDFNLGVGSASHGAQTAEMLAKLETLLLRERPDWVLVYGDTNSTMAGALAAAKLRIPVAHVEAGLRSYNRGMPEEINRIVADHLSQLLFCPSQTAVGNLKKEGISEGVFEVGDVMADVLYHAVHHTPVIAEPMQRFGLKEKCYILATIHRAENTDNPQKLKNIVSGLLSLNEPVLFPLHPRTRKALQNQGLWTKLSADDNLIYLIEPQGYLNMIKLEQSARVILTDSGGVQKEAYWLGVPCLTLRGETEWVETVIAGWNVLVGTDAEVILEQVRSFKPPEQRPQLYGDGRAAKRCVGLLSEFQVNVYN